MTTIEKNLHWLDRYLGIHPCTAHALREHLDKAKDEFVLKDIDLRLVFVLCGNMQKARDAEAIFLESLRELALTVRQRSMSGHVNIYKETQIQFVSKLDSIERLMGHDPKTTAVMEVFLG
jgi:hypothetical protein